MIKTVRTKVRPPFGGNAGDHGKARSGFHVDIALQFRHLIRSVDLTQALPPQLHKKRISPQRALRSTANFSRKNAVHGGTEYSFFEAPRQGRQRQQVVEEAKIHKGVPDLGQERRDTGIIPFEEIRNGRRTIAPVGGGPR